LPSNGFRFVFVPPEQQDVPPPDIPPTDPWLALGDPLPPDVSIPFVDHIVLLLPEELVLGPPSWLTNHFTITNGSFDTDGLTVNRLICLKSGSFIKLIAFRPNLTEKEKMGHQWGDKKPGFIDWCLSNWQMDRPHHSLRFAHINREIPHPLPPFEMSAAPQSILYHHPVQKVSLNAYGQEASWRVTCPADLRRGGAPFFVHDITPRSRRVPTPCSTTSDPTQHPTGSLAIDHMYLVTFPDQVLGWAEAIARVMHVTTIRATTDPRGHLMCRISARQFIPTGGHGIQTPPMAIDVGPPRDSLEIHRLIRVEKGGPYLSEVGFRVDDTMAPWAIRAVIEEGCTVSMGFTPLIPKPAWTTLLVPPA
jgi:hypothetical protein